MALCRIGRRWCGDGHPIYLAFEIGPTITSYASAEILTRIAADAGADAIKVQILDPARLVGDDVAVTYATATLGTREGSMLEILRRRVLVADDWRKLAAMAHELGLDFIATVDFPKTLDLALECQADAIKVCSGDIAMLPWICRVAQTGLPVMLDTGHATLGEVERAVDAVLGEENDRVVVHHTPGGYPARLQSVNLRVVTTLRQMFPDCVTAFSDHSCGRDMDVAAVALGAAMIEKTLTLDRTQDSPEHMFSIEPLGARGFVQAIRDVEVALGRPRRLLTDAERESKRKARRSLYTTEAVPLHRLVCPGEGNGFEWRRPGGGIEPPDLDEARRPMSRRDLPAGHRVRWQDLE